MPSMSFARWWNLLARITGKQKFRTEREAEKFIRDLAKKSPGPNEKIIQMRREYESIKKANRSADTDRTPARQTSTV